MSSRKGHTLGAALALLGATPAGGSHVGFQELAIRFRPTTTIPFPKLQRTVEMDANKAFKAEAKRIRKAARRGHK